MQVENYEFRTLKPAMPWLHGCLVGMYGGHCIAGTGEPVNAHVQ